MQKIILGTHLILQIIKKKKKKLKRIWSLEFSCSSSPSSHFFVFPAKKGKRNWRFGSITPSANRMGMKSPAINELIPGTFFNAGGVTDSDTVQVGFHSLPSQQSCPMPPVLHLLVFVTLSLFGFLNVMVKQIRGGF